MPAWTSAVRLAASVTCTIAFSCASLHAQTSSAAPDVVGIRPGMPAQEAYTALKAHSNGAKIGVGQTMLPGIPQPVVVLMSLQVLGASPAETITVWLTVPPEKQVVWGIRRTLIFERGKELTRNAIMDGLRQKYGPEIHSGVDYWNFDEQGNHASVKDMTFNHCAGQFGLSEPNDYVNPQPITSLITAFVAPTNPCNNFIAIRAEWIGASNGSNELAGGITVILEDVPAALRSRRAYQNLVANGADAAHKQELDKANQQQKPTF